MVDVCLVLEGTYPKLTGGLSEWVQQLTEGLDDVSFAVAHLAHDQTPPHADAYQPPSNVTEVREIALDPDHPVDARNFEDRMPDARVYHALSTGVAGSVAGRVAQALRRPMVLTEHGLYWREVRFLPGVRGDYQGQWQGSARRVTDPHEVREEWAQALEQMAHATYPLAGEITTVCTANARRQRQAGAPAVNVIPNAVSLPGLREAEAGAPRSGERLTVGVVARVSPIKDILGFVRACRVVAEERPDTDFVVLGPLDHDPAYAGRCLELADEIGLGERLRFLGEVDPAPWYPRLDVVVSPSVSEGQPLALLEAMAAGLPVVTTDVGGCAELVAGGRGRAAAGLVVAPASPRATGRAILSLCSDAALRQRMGAEGRRRVAARHRPEQFLRAYRGVYDRALARAA